MSPSREVTPLPQPLQMAARRLTQADRLGAPGQMGLAPASSFPPLFPLAFCSIFLIFLYNSPPPEAPPPMLARDKDFPTPQPGGGGQEPGMHRVFGTTLQTGPANAKRDLNPPACWMHRSCGN